MFKRAAFPLAVLCVALAGCAQQPQTRQEYVNAVSSGDHMFVMKDTYVSKRGFDQVVAAVKQKAEECGNFTRTRTITTGGLPTGGSRTDWNTAVRVVGPGRAELTSQYNMAGIVLAKVPEGGIFGMAVDIERTSPTTTRLSYYGMKKDKEVWEAIRNWADGSMAGCPST